MFFTLKMPYMFYTTHATVIPFTPFLAPFFKKLIDAQHNS